MTVPPQRPSTSCSRRPPPAIAAHRHLAFRAANVRHDTPRSLIAARPPDAGKTRAAWRAAARLPPENFRLTRPPRAAPNARRESPEAPIRASAITNPVSRTLSRRFGEKNFQQPGIAALRSLARASWRKNFSPRACAGVRVENCDGVKTLVPCGFLRNAKKRSASLKSSP